MFDKLCALDYLTVYVKNTCRLMSYLLVGMEYLRFSTYQTKIALNISMLSFWATFLVLFIFIRIPSVSLLQTERIALP